MDYKKWKYKRKKERQKKNKKPRMYYRELELNKEPYWQEQWCTGRTKDKQNLTRTIKNGRKSKRRKANHQGHTRKDFFDGPKDKVQDKSLIKGIEQQDS
eukprot:10916137-Heterocapsa_arctica.AAC.1